MNVLSRADLITPALSALIPPSSSIISTAMCSLRESTLSTTARGETSRVPFITASAAAALGMEDLWGSETFVKGEDANCAAFYRYQVINYASYKK